MKPAYFGQSSCRTNIDKNNYPEETDINPSLTQADTLTLSIGERHFGRFTSSRCYDTSIFNFAHTHTYEFTIQSGEGSGVYI